MATDLQNEANRKNAAASTGPKSPEGKSISARNAVSHGLFSATDILHPHEINEFTELSAAMQEDLAPNGILEQTLATEITRAAWRLRRCSNVEDSLIDIDPYTDPMAHPATERTQKSVDRARAQTHGILHRAITALRRLQNERLFRHEILPDDFKTADLGLASYKDLMPALAAEKRSQLLKQIPVTKQTQSHQKNRTQSAPPAISNTAPLAMPPTATPRNAPCPCGSGQKHKRCCGKNAPAVLNFGPHKGLAKAA